MSQQQRRRRMLTGLVLLAGLTLPLAPAQAAPSRHVSVGPSFLEGLAGVLRDWFAVLHPHPVQKNGGVTDPNGSPSGGTAGAVLPSGSMNENGGMTDPNG